MHARNTKRPRTLHVEVNEVSGDHVSIAVPMGFAKAALRIAGKVDVDLEDDDIKVEELREAWSELRDSKESVVVDVQDGTDSIHITNQKGMVNVDLLSADGDIVKIQLPEAAIDALLSSDGNKLDLAAALGALEEGHVGDLVEIEDGSDHVRIWID